MRPRSLALGFALTLALPLALSVGCASTTIEHVWRAPDFSGSFTHVAVFGLAKQPAVRRDFELEMVAAFANVGVQASPSFDLFPNQDAELSDEDIARVLAEHHIDAALVVRVVGVGTQERNVSGEPFATIQGGPPPGFFGDYHRNYAVIDAPDVTMDFEMVTLETKIYQVANSELVWSGLSETFAPESVDETIESYSQVMVTALIEAGLVTRTITPGAIESQR